MLQAARVAHNVETGALDTRVPRVASGSDECTACRRPSRRAALETKEHVVADDLTAAKAERRRLRTELTAIAAKRTTAGEPVAALERAEGEAAKVAYDAAVSQWLHGGSLGRRPQRDDVLNGHTSPELSAARRAAADVLPELERLAAEERGIREEFDVAHAEVIDLAAKQMGAEYAALGARAGELRQELDEIETHLVAGATYFGEISDFHYQRNHRHSPALAAPKQIAIEGLAWLTEEEVRAGSTAGSVQLPMPDRAAIAVHRDRFEGLQGE
jgi:hypothetical protein